MAILRGNARRGVELVIVEYPNCYSKDNSLAFLDVMVRPAKGVPHQAVPHLMSKKNKVNGKWICDHRACYTMAQRDAFRAMAGDNIAEIPSYKNWSNVLAYAIKANVLPAPGNRGIGYVIDGRTIQPSTLEPIDETILSKFDAASKTEMSRFESYVVTKDAVSSERVSETSGLEF